jgi:hypothetical protein
VNMTLSPDDCVMNTHVMMLDLPRYQQYSIPQRITTLGVRHRVRAMWSHASAFAPFVLALQGHILRVDGQWDVTRLGIDPDLSQKQLDDAFVLHWTGPRYNAHAKKSHLSPIWSQSRGWINTLVAT